MTGDTVVLGAAIDLTVEQVTPFLRSLRSAGFDGEIVLAVDRSLRRRLENEPVASGVRLVWAPTLLPLSFARVRRVRALRLTWFATQSALWRIVRTVAWLPISAAARAMLGAAIARLVCTPMEARFLWYRRFLARNPHERVLLCDVRDVVFQKEPFGDLPVEGLAVGIESHRYTVATEPHNALWVRQAFGQEMLDRIGARPVSCVGVTYGDRRAMSAYLDLMTDAILRLPAAAARRGGADTAIHNVLVWTNQIVPVQLLETLDSPLATLNGFSGGEVRLSVRGTLLNRDGSEPSIVHQYDRVPGLACILLRSMCASGGPR